MPRLLRRLRHLLLATCLLGLAVTRPALAAVDYTDIWWNPAESGWGVNLVQSNDFIFATFFIYGTGKLPKWVVAQLRRDAATGAWTGPVYTTEGTHFSQTWDAKNDKVQKVGDASFEPSGASSGKLTYNIGASNVTKTITRQTLTAIPLDGEYYASGVFSLTGCADSAKNASAAFPLPLKITHAGDTTTIDIGTGSFILTGKLIQEGSHMRIPVAALSLPYFDPPETAAAARADQLKRTDLGVDGTVSALLSGGCIFALTFSALTFTFTP